MKIDNFELVDEEAFPKRVNISLFNNIVDFVAETSDKEIPDFFSTFKREHPWYQPSGTKNIQEKYGFRYFGELSERYGERLGDTIENCRAIALAFAYVRDLLTDDMFVADQRADFIRKIQRLSANDIYLKGALYLLYKEDDRADILLQELIRTHYQHTEELIFVLSLFDEFEKGFAIFKSQLLDLLGASRTVPVVHNMKFFAWLIRHLCPLTKKIRTKDMALFRALVGLPTSFAKDGSRSRNILLENRYSLEEIVYANNTLLDYIPVRGTIPRSSMVAEKIAIEFCTVFLSSEHVHAEDTYSYLAWLFQRYKHFDIRCYGNDTLEFAVSGTARLKTPETFIWLYRIFQSRSLFHFDILDPKWNALAKWMSEEDYLVLFNSQLLWEENLTAEKMMDYIRKYDALTGKSYLLDFQKYNYRNGIFSLLVEKGIINLKEAFLSAIEQPESENGNPEYVPSGMLVYIREYIEDVKNKKAYEFFQFFFENYDGAELEDFFGKQFRFSHSLYNGPGRHYYYGGREKEIDIERTFLSVEEHRQLFNWLDDYMFKNQAEDYLNFIVCVLKSDFIETIIPKAELRRLYDAICQTDPDLLKPNLKYFKQKYLTEAELFADKTLEEAKEKEQKRLAMLKREQEIREKLSQKYDGTAHSLLEFQGHYYSWNEDRGVALRAIRELFDNLLESKNYMLTLNEAGSFIRLSGILVEEKAITLEECKNYLSKVEEEIDNGKDAESCASDTDAQ